MPAPTAIPMQKISITTDFLVVGGGVIGINIGRGLKKRYTTSKVTLIEYSEPLCPRVPET